MNLAWRTSEQKASNKACEVKRIGISIYSVHERWLEMEEAVLNMRDGRKRRRRSPNKIVSSLALFIDGSIAGTRAVIRVLFLAITAPYPQ